jgi:hypothetical protein
MNGLFNGGTKIKKVNAAVRVGHYGLRALEAEACND